MPETRVRSWSGVGLAGLGRNVAIGGAGAAAGRTAAGVPDGAGPPKSILVAPQPAQVPVVRGRPAGVRAGLAFTGARWSPQQGQGELPGAPPWAG
jgi:hypothetical protein